MNLLITDIKQLLTLKGPKKLRVGKKLSDIGMIKDAAVFIEDGVIKYYGRERDVISKIKKEKYIHIKANGVVMPAFVDCHTHSVFAYPRLFDFELRSKGYSYQEIKKNGGGINLSAKHLKEVSDDFLFNNLLKFLKLFNECGTATLEIKSGYGLDFENEVKILEVIKKAKIHSKTEIFSTFLGAHSIPDGYTASAYLKYLKKEVVPYVSKNNLADFVDIFCEKGYFDIEQSVDYLNYCRKFGLIPRIHADQFSRSGGCYVAYKTKSVSADHLDFADDECIRFLKRSNTIATFLPASNYFLGVPKYPNARKFIENGNPVALASDFNPGSSPCWNMQFVLSLAVNYMKMTVEQAIVASTYNAACSLGIGNKTGMIDENMSADLAIFDCDDYREICYYFGSNINKMTIKRGMIIYEKNSSF